MCLKVLEGEDHGDGSGGLVAGRGLKKLDLAEIKARKAAEAKKLEARKIEEARKLEAKKLEETKKMEKEAKRATSGAASSAGANAGAAASSAGAAVVGAAAVLVTQKALAAQEAVALASMPQIQVGCNLPAATLYAGTPDAKVQTSSLSRGRTILIVGLPGAFTPT